MPIHVKHRKYQIINDFFHSQDDLGKPTKDIVNTAGCTLDTCVPIGLQTINATGRGNYIVPTNYESPFCGTFFETSLSKLNLHENPLYMKDQNVSYLFTCYLTIYILPSLTWC